MREILSRRAFFGVAPALWWGRLKPATPQPASPLLPAPQKLSLTGARIPFGDDWRIELGAGVTRQHIAVRTLQTAGNDYGIALGRGSKVLELGIRPESRVQGYRLQIQPDRIAISGNGDPGLLYGVSTLLQLLDSGRGNGLELPAGEIEDWPDLELRVIHWCEKEHQSRLETLKEYLDRAAYFKINAVGWHLESTFAYRKHPAISVPTAFTPDQIREIDQYARERYIELIPMVDFPAHMSYVLRHPEFAHLREVPDSSYMICPTNPASWELIFDMLGEVCDAFQGKYFLFSTDELFFDRYRGSKCGCAEKIRQVGPSGLFVEITNKASEFLMQRGKRVMFWGERPLEVKDIPKLPSSSIDAVEGWYSLERPGELETERKHGMQALMYFSTKGGEKQMFPDYLPFKHHDIFSRNHLSTMQEIIARGEARKSDNILGTFVAAWDDHGINLEIVWLGLVAGSCYGWNTEPSSGELLPRFTKLFYGAEAGSMREIYELMNDCALFWTFSWDRRKGISLPNLPDPATLDNHPYWNGQYSRITYVKDRSQAKQAVAHQSYVPTARSEGVFDDLGKEKELTQRLVRLLSERLTRVSRHKYNVEVMLAIAKAMDHNVNLFHSLGAIEDELSAAYRMKRSGRNKEAAALLAKAQAFAEGIVQERERVYADFVKTWKKSRFPSPQMDVLRRERNLGLEKWINDLGQVRIG
jgi:hexosaminidase